METFFLKLINNRYQIDTLYQSYDTHSHTYSWLLMITNIYLCQATLPSTQITFVLKLSFVFRMTEQQVVPANMFIWLLAAWAVLDLTGTIEVYQETVDKLVRSVLSVLECSYQQHVRCWALLRLLRSIKRRQTSCCVVYWVCWNVLTSSMCVAGPY